MQSRANAFSDYLEFLAVEVMLAWTESAQTLAPFDFGITSEHIPTTVRPIWNTLERLASKRGLPNHEKFWKHPPHRDLLSRLVIDRNAVPTVEVACKAFAETLAVIEAQAAIQDAFQRGWEQSDLVGCLEEVRSIADLKQRGAQSNQSLKSWAPTDLLKQFDPDLSNVVSTGFDDLDYALGGGLRKVSYLAAATGAGKSWALLHVAVNVARAGGRVLFVSMEMSDFEISQRLFTILCGTSYTEVLNAGLQKSDISKLLSQVKKQKRLGKYREIHKSDGGIYLLDETQFSSFERVATQAAYEAYDLVIVDSFYEAVPDRNIEKMNVLVQKIKNCQTISCCPWLVSTQFSTKYITPKSDVLSGISYTAQITTTAASVVILRSDKVDRGLMPVTIGKARFGPPVPVGQGLFVENLPTNSPILEFRSCDAKGAPGLVSNQEAEDGILDGDDDF